MIEEISSNKSGINPRLRVKYAIFGPAPDNIPCGELVIADDFLQQHLNLEDTNFSSRQVSRELIEVLGLDLVVVRLSWGWGHTEQPDIEGALADIEWWQHETDRFVFALMDGPFSFIVKNWGFMEAMEKIICTPEDVRSAFESYIIKIRRQIHLVASAGADGLIVGDDIAGNDQLLIRPDTLRHLGYFNILEQFVAEGHQVVADGKLPVFYHSDGNLMDVLRDLAMAGFDGFQGLEPGANMSLLKVREAVGPQICLWGNIDPIWLTEPHNIEEFTMLVNELSQDAGPRFILGTAGGLFGGMNSESVVKLYRHAKVIGE